MSFDDDLTARLIAKADAARKRLIAYHEAAHALVGVLLGQELVSVSMDGQTCFTPCSDDPDQILAHAKIALAGTVGEALGLGGSHPLGPARDFPQAVEMLKRLGPNRPLAQDLSREVKQLLLENEPALHRVAKALMKEGCLNGARVSELLAAPESP
jgi:ATP-dependent Zn protease